LSSMFAMVNMIGDFIQPYFYRRYRVHHISACGGFRPLTERTTHDGNPPSEPMSLVRASSSRTIEEHHDE
jgi:hypothetical protein